MLQFSHDISDFYHWQWGFTRYSNDISTENWLYYNFMCSSLIYFYLTCVNKWCISNYFLDWIFSYMFHIHMALLQVVILSHDFLSKFLVTYVAFKLFIARLLMCERHDKTLQNKLSCLWINFCQSFWGMHCPFRWGACNLSTKSTFVFNMSTMHESVVRWKFQYEQITCDMCDVNLQCFCLIHLVSRGDISHNEIIRLLWTFWWGISFYFMAWNIYQFDHISNFQTYVNPRWSFFSLWMFLLKM